MCLYHHFTDVSFMDTSADEFAVVIFRVISNYTAVTYTYDALSLDYLPICVWCERCFMCIYAYIRIYVYTVDSQV